MCIRDSGHGQGDHFVRAGDDAWEGIFPLLLPFHDRFDDAGVVGAEVDEAVRDAGLEYGCVRQMSWCARGGEEGSAPPIAPRRRRRMLYTSCVRRSTAVGWGLASRRSVGQVEGERWELRMEMGLTCFGDPRAGTGTRVHDVPADIICLVGRRFGAT